jgi:GGDEF domain-containing protein
MFAGTPPARPARPVADDTVRLLAAAGEELAKGWLLALMVDEPLERAPRLAGGLLEADAPTLCSAVVLALGSERDLEAIGPGGALEGLVRDAAMAAGGGSLEGALSALSLLRRTVWAALRRALRDPDPDLVADLAARLALAADTLCRVVLRSSSAAMPPPAHQAKLASAAADGLEGQAAAGLEGRAEAAGLEGRAKAQGREGRVETEPLAAGEVSRSAQGDRVAPTQSAPIEPLWRAAIAEEVERLRGCGLALLLVALQDAERVRQIEPEAKAGIVLTQFTHALRTSLRRQDILATEREGRAWVLAPGLDLRGATALAQRITRSIETAPQWRGAPMRAAVGIAILGADGEDAPTLCERAEEAMLAAMAAGAVTPLPAAASARGDGDG